MSRRDIMKRLSDEEIGKKMRTLPSWRKSRNKIRKKFMFPDFVGAMAFVTSVALVAESAHHHPLILIQWNKVTLTLWTHTEGGVTQKDFTMAMKTDDVLASLSRSE